MSARNAVRLIPVLVVAALAGCHQVWEAKEVVEASGARPEVPGGLVVFTEHATSGGYAGDTDVGAQLLSLGGELLWEEGERSLPVSDAKVLERNAVAVADGTGGFIVAFEVVFVTGEQTRDVDIYAQRLSATGERLWNGGERPVAVAESVWQERSPVIVPDGDGGAIIIFEAHLPRGSEYAGDSNIRAQRISPQGTLLWHQGERSAIVSTSTMPERAPTAVPDGRGGAIVVFEVEVTSGQYQGDVDLYAQRLDASGRMLWNKGEVSCKLAVGEWRERRPLAVADGAGGAVVVFEEHGPPGTEHEGDIDVAAQRISGEGELLWGQDRSLPVGEADGFLERTPALLPDGAGGAWVIFEAEAPSGENAGDTELLAQRVSPTGELTWPQGPVIVAASARSERAPVVVSDGAGGVIVIFEAHGPPGSDQAGDVDIAAQRLSPAGKRLWNDGEKSALVSSGEWLERRPSALPDGVGGAIVVFEAEARQGERADDTDIFAQRLDASGTILWNQGQRSTMVAGSEWEETGPRIVAVR